MPPTAPSTYATDPVDAWTIWWLRVAGSDVSELVAETGLGTDRPVRAMRDAARSVALAEQVCDSLERGGARSNLIRAAGSAWHLLSLQVVEHEAPPAVRDRVIETIRFSLADTLTAPPPVSALAARTGLSVSHFSARFRALTGESVTGYVKRLRMTQAQHLLITSDLSIAQVARRVGFRDPYYLSRQFRAVHAVSPSGFRAAHRTTVR